MLQARVEGWWDDRRL